jgi:hypothetical protein
MSGTKFCTLTDVSGTGFNFANWVSEQLRRLVYLRGNVYISVWRDLRQKVLST